MFYFWYQLATRKLCLMLHLDLKIFSPTLNSFTDGELMPPHDFRKAILPAPCNTMSESYHSGWSMCSPAWGIQYSAVSELDHAPSQPSLAIASATEDSLLVPLASFENGVLPPLPSLRDTLLLQPPGFRDLAVESQSEFRCILKQCFCQKFHPFTQLRTFYPTYDQFELYAHAQFQRHTQLHACAQFKPRAHALLKFCTHTRSYDLAVEWHKDQGLTILCIIQKSVYFWDKCILHSFRIFFGELNIH